MNSKCEDLIFWAGNLNTFYSLASGPTVYGTSEPLPVVIYLLSMWFIDN